MDRLTAKKIRYFIRLQYPVTVTAVDGGFRGAYPDLAGCTGTATDLGVLYGMLEEKRRSFITRALLAGNEVPLPNAHTRARPITRRFLRPSPAASAQA